MDRTDRNAMLLCYALDRRTTVSAPAAFDWTDTALFCCCPMFRPICHGQAVLAALAHVYLLVCAYHVQLLCKSYTLEWFGWFFKRLTNLTKLHSKGFWRWCVTLITTKLLDFVHRPDFYKEKTQRFGNWIACGKASFRFFCRVGAPSHRLKTETDPVSETLCFL
jgi:hypothetical protein